jgi:ABC-type branched-subunit amino acid transport system permease subunit
MRSADRVRGGLAGVTCGVLAIAAHGFEGDLPHSAAWALLLLVSGVVGTAIGSPTGRGRVRLFSMLALGQLFGHLALSAAGTTHVHREVEGVGREGWLVLAAHGVATMLCALLIVAAERVYTAASTVVRTLLTRFEPLPVIGDGAVPAPPVVHRCREVLLRAAISRRGPPV